MSLGSIITTAISEISSRISLVGVIPSILLVLFFVFLIFSFNVPPTLYPKLDLILEKIVAITVEQFAVILILIVIFSLIIEPLQLILMRIFEGYWKTTGFVGKIRDIRKWE